MFTILAATAVAGLADIPNPNREKRELPKVSNGEMSIRTSSPDVSIATVKISKSKLKALRAAIDAADDQNNTSASIGDDGTTPAARTQTLIAGMLLSVAMVMGGFIFFRGSSRSGRVPLSIAAIAGIGFGAVAVVANTPPPRLVGLTSQIFARETKRYGYARGQVAISVVDDKNMRSDIELEFPAAGDDKNEE